jgi:BirA family biotin operon repressor/biotin-[acetyl-CoA-carboxylase] ligase
MSVDSCVLNDGQVARLAHTRFATLARLGETASTNSVLVAHARRGAPEGLVVVADHQSAGRGRFQRRWESRPGRSLLFSVLLRPRREDLPAGRRHLATAAVALALVEGARMATAAELRLKWPNDIIGSDPVQGEAKVAGILAESPDGDALVVGAGMNVSWAPEGMGATCLSALGPGGRQALDREELDGRDLDREELDSGELDRGEVLVESLLVLERLYGQWDLVGRLYRQSCATIGREVSVTLSEGSPPLIGTAVTTDDDGHLVVRAGTGPDGREELVTVAAGDVAHVRPA